MEAGEGGEGRESPALAYGGGGGEGGQGENEYAAEGYPNYGGNGHQVHGEEAPAAGAAVAFPTSVYRESLGFLRARKKLTLPGVGMEPGEVDGGTLAGLAVMERFGFLLVSCSTGERVREREVDYHSHLDQAGHGWSVLLVLVLVLLRQLQARCKSPTSSLSREHELLRRAIAVDWLSVCGLPRTLWLFCSRLLLLGHSHSACGKYNRRRDRFNNAA